MIRRPPESTRTDTLLPYTTLFRSAQAHEQLDAALAAGVNFVDTAEMYPVAPRAETYGRTEQIIGSWLARTARRHDIILASKVIGPGAFPYVRGGPRLD